MIVPMKKVTLITLQSECENALVSLRDLGVMQVELDGRFSSDSAAAAEKMNTYKRILSVLEQIAVENKISTDFSAKAESAEKIADLVAAIIEQRTSIAGEITDLRRRQEMLAVWGDFDRKLLDELNASGVHFLLCSGTSEDFAKAQAMENVNCREISGGKGRVAFVVIAVDEVDESQFPVVNLTDKDDPAALRKKIAALEKEDKKLDDELRKLAASRHILISAIEDESCVWEFCRVRDSIAEYGEIVTVSGFVPLPEIDKVRSAAEKNGWGLLILDPAEDDDVPVLLKENKFTRIIKPLFDFLGIVPGYREIDISGAVLIFFTIFYAIIIGDAGYGILFGAISGFGLLAAKKVPRLLAPMRLLLVLSVAATVWGALCGSWFGMSTIPGTDQPFPALECFRDFAGSAAKQANIQFFCFILAVVQLSVGRIWRVISERNWKAAGQHLGWMLIIWGNFFLTIRLIVYPGEFPTYMYVLYGIGLALVMFCGVNWKQASDVFQFPFDIIGSFTDVLSYIRLFAVGLAGACIAGSFNGMAFDLCQVSAWLLPAGVLVVLVGHALNIALALLSVLVHAVRLNTLEFSNHTGLSWSGQSFNPFKSNKKEE